MSCDFEPCDVAPLQTAETNFTNVSIDPEKQLHSDESSEESDEDSIGEPSTICLARQEDDIAAVLDYLIILAGILFQVMTSQLAQTMISVVERVTSL